MFMLLEMFAHWVESFGWIYKDEKDDSEWEVNDVCKNFVVEDVLKLGLKFLKEFSHGSEDVDSESEGEDDECN